MPSSAKRPKAVEAETRNRPFCPQCGIGVVVDEDFCCRQCGCVCCLEDFVREHLRIVPVPLNRTRRNAEPDGPKDRRAGHTTARKPRRRAARRKA